MVPERGLFGGPKAEQPVIGGDGVDAVPKQRAELVGQGEVGEGFAVDESLAFGDLQADGADDFGLGVLGDLEFSYTAGQVFDGKFHRIPKGGQGADIVKGGSPDTVVGIHSRRNFKGREEGLQGYLGYMVRGVVSHRQLRIAN